MESSIGLKPTDREADPAALVVDVDDLVKVFDDAPPDCKVTVGTTLTFHKAVDTVSAAGNGVAGTRTETIACGTAGRP